MAAGKQILVDGFALLSRSSLAFALILSAVAVLFDLAPAQAAPPASCARKYIGTWQITVLATGQRYPARINADGTAVPNCPMCMSGTWTCSGNTFINVSPVSLTSALSADGRRMTSGCCTAVRIGGAAVAADGEGAAGGQQKQLQGQTSAGAPQSKEWSSCAGGPAEPGIVACSTLIKTKMSGSKRLNPDDIGWAYGMRGSHRMAARDYESAMADIEQSMKLRLPKNLEFSYVIRGLIHQTLLDHPRAIADFTKAIEINPRFGGSYVHRGRSYLMMGDPQRGDPDFQRAPQVTPENREIYAVQKELLVDWLAYLKEIQDSRDYANWSTPPLEALRGR